MSKHSNKLPKLGGFAPAPLLGVGLRPHTPFCYINVSLTSLTSFSMCPSRLLGGFKGLSRIDICSALVFYHFLGDF